MKLPKIKRPSGIPDKNWGIGLLFSFASFILLIMLICTAIYELHFILNSKTAEGEVVALDFGRAHVSVKFKTSDGKLITYPQNGIVSYSAGEKVTVLYDPERPGRFASTNAIGALWSGTIALLFFTVVFSLAAVLSFKSTKDIFRH